MTLTVACGALFHAAVADAAPPEGGHAAPKDPNTEREELPPPPGYGDPNGPTTAPNAARGWKTPPPTEPEDVYLFAPRGVLYVPKLVLALVYLPLRKGAELVNEYHLIERTEDLLYNDERTAAILPAVSYQSGFGLSFGASTFHNDVFGHDEKLSGDVLYGALYAQSYNISFAGDHVGGIPLWLELDTSWEVQPARLFFGIGDRGLSEGGADLDPTQVSVATRYRVARQMANVTVGTALGKQGNRSRAAINMLYNHRRFGPEDRPFTEPSIEEVYDVTKIPGYVDGASVLELTPMFVYDTRDTEGFTSAGNYFETFVGHTLPISNADFWHYGVTFATFFNLYHKTRVLSLRAVWEAVHGDDEDIPFSDLIRLGGPERLRGYRLDRFRNKRALVATAEYQYPIHEIINGEVFFDVGRTGAEYSDILSEKGLSSLHYGGGLGLVFHNEDKIYFKLEAAYGEELTLFFTTDPLKAFSGRHERL